MPPRRVFGPEARRRTLRQLLGRHSRLSTLSHCGETYSLKSGIDTHEPMSSVITQYRRKGKSRTAMEKRRNDRYQMLLEVAVSTLYVGGPVVLVASLLT